MLACFSCAKFEYFICVAGGNGKSTNPFVKILIENIFARNGFAEKVTPYNGRYSEYDVIKEKKRKGISPTNGSVLMWRDDIEYPPTCRQYAFEHALYNVEGHRCNTSRHVYYNIFWNLFLIALDDEIYNEQMMNVVELAYFFDFDAPMLRDWCRAVEYVIDGNKLSENCDFECETVEGARFFLHKEYE